MSQYGILPIKCDNTEALPSPAASYLFGVKAAGLYLRTGYRLFDNGSFTCTRAAG
jgi:hypothetical protein